jgi:hypothetical protein
MKVSKLSRLDLSCLPVKKAPWSTPSMGRSAGTCAPMMPASVEKKSWTDTISLLARGATLPGHLIMPTVRIEPSSASPSSPRHGPFEPPRESAGPAVGLAALSEIQITIVLSSTLAALMASSTWPVRWSSSMIASPYGPMRDLPENSGPTTVG